VQQNCGTPTTQCNTTDATPLTDNTVQEVATVSTAPSNLQGIELHQQPPKYDEEARTHHWGNAKEDSALIIGAPKRHVFLQRLGSQFLRIESTRVNLIVLAISSERAP